MTIANPYKKGNRDSAFIGESLLLFVVNWMHIQFRKILKLIDTRP